ncbi:MAG TPA: cytochrome c-type biogenesis protein CcmH [Chloroflexi bacterium]|nr:cytochrome c-type biogenesis protein CcmH [Chloroflexota bacterium]
MKKRITWLLPLLSLSFLLLGVVSVQAQSGTPHTPTDDEVNAVASQLYCPVCENIPLDVCGTQACAQWRDLIREKLSEGWTTEEIKTYFVEQYGDRVLATPPPRGLNWLVYVLPPLLILAGAVILVQAFRAWKTPTEEPLEAEMAPSTPEAAFSDDEYIARLEEELKNR